MPPPRAGTYTSSYRNMPLAEKLPQTLFFPSFPPHEKKKKGILGIRGAWRKLLWEKLPLFIESQVLSKCNTSSPVVKYCTMHVKRQFKCACVYYYWKQRGNTDCIHYVCTVFNTTEGRLSRDFWKMTWLTRSLSLTTVTESVHRKRPFFSVPWINGSISSVLHTYDTFIKAVLLHRNTSHFVFIVAAKTSTWEGIF